MSGSSRVRSPHVLLLDEVVARLLYLRAVNAQGALEIAKLQETTEKLKHQEKIKVS